MTRKPNLHSVKDTNHSGKNSRQQAEVVRALSYFLSSSYVLYQKTWFYHWNVTGPNFASLHQLFEQQYTEMQGAVDEIAERIRALEAPAPGTLAEFVSMSSISEDRKIPGTAEMISNLYKAHVACAKEAARLREVAESASDEVTVDLMNQRQAFHDKTAWMLKALQE